MPMHDWTRADDGVFHQFHQDFVAQLARRLNAGLLPDPLYALLDRKPLTKGDDVPLHVAPDVLAVSAPGADAPAGGLSVLTAPPPARHRDRGEVEAYTRLANRVAVRTSDGDELVAVFELVSPGNKSSQRRFDLFARKCGRLISRGVHVTLADFHPPTRRDPDGLHPVVWAAVVGDRPYRLPPDKPYTLAAYAAGNPADAYVEQVGVGDRLPDTPLFLTPERYVLLPLEAVYADCWAALPKRLKQRVEPPADA